MKASSSSSHENSEHSGVRAHDFAKNHKEKEVSNPTSSHSVTDLSAEEIHKLRISKSYLLTAPTRKVYTSVAVGKPHKGDFFRIHPEEEMHFDALLLEHGVGMEKHVYLVMPQLQDALSGEVVIKRLFFCVTRQGHPFLWSIKLPDAEGRIDTWNASAMDAVEVAKRQWMRLVSNGKGYEILVAEGNLSEPEFPDLTIEQLMNLAFRQRIIRDMDHPVLKKLRGIEQ